MSLIVTGTDTGVGKTVVSALVLLRYAGAAPLAYWKPVASAAADGRDARSVERWTGAPVVPERYLFRPPVSPHLAARRARRPIEPRRILDAFARLRAADPSRQLVVEGVGGVLVPLTDSGYLFADLARDLGLPCLVVARSTLGTINHTLLTLEALARRGIRPAGVVLDGPANPENRRAIERFGAVPVVGEVRPLRAMTRAALARAARRFDQPGILEPFLS